MHATKHTNPLSAIGHCVFGARNWASALHTMKPFGAENGTRNTKKCIRVLCFEMLEPDTDKYK